MCQVRRVDKKIEAPAETSRKESTPPSTLSLTLTETYLFMDWFQPVLFVADSLPACWESAMNLFRPPHLTTNQW